MSPRRHFYLRKFLQVLPSQPIGSLLAGELANFGSLWAIFPVYVLAHGPYLCKLYHFFLFHLHLSSSSFFFSHFALSFRISSNKLQLDPVRTVFSSLFSNVHIFLLGWRNCILFFTMKMFLASMCEKYSYLSAVIAVQRQKQTTYKKLGYFQQNAANMLCEIFFKMLYPCSCGMLLFLFCNNHMLAFTVW